MERMDYLDRFFEPQRFAAQQQAPGAEAVATAAAVETDPAAGWPPQAERVVAMEPIPDRPVASARERHAAPTAARGAEAEPGPAREADAESHTRSLVRQHRWLTQFWMELTPAQQQRVARRLNGGGDVRLASGQADAEAAWDRMGLSDRAKLVFGGAPAERPEPAERDDGAVVARNR